MLPAARTARDCRSLRGFISYLTRRCRSENCWSAAPAGLGPILPPIRMSLAVTKVIVNRNAISRKSFGAAARGRVDRSEEHTSELQSRFDLVCRLLLEKKKKRNTHSE